MLADATITKATEKIANEAPGIAEKFQSIEMPTVDNIISTLQNMQAWLAFVLLVVGVIYLLLGWKAFKVLVVANCAVLGAAIGYSLGAKQGGNMPLFAGGAGGLLLAVLSWPLMKCAVSLMGALAGGMLGWAAWHYVASTTGEGELVKYAWAGAALGVIALGLLGLVAQKFVVKAFTSLQGAAMGVAGALAIAMMNESANEELTKLIRENHHILPLMVAVPALIGFTFQYAGSAKKAKKPKGGE